MSDLTKQAPKFSVNIVYLICALLISVCCTGEVNEQFDADIMLERLRLYHDMPTSERLLHVVYFHPAGTPPQKDFRQRIKRIMQDIQTFYRDEMARNGFGNITFPLDITDGELRIHVVEGQDPASEYGHDNKYGRKIKQEISNALKGTLDLDREFVIVFNGMCTKEGKDRYLFYAPYYGDSNSDYRRGLCHVADCELLDPLLLEKTDREVEYKEHYGKYKQTLNAFNSKYLGGVAHELGHALSLPHNGQMKAEQKQYGLALMGSGNHTYRRERWDDKKGTFLTMSSATRLASHPLFYGSTRGQNARIQCNVEELQFSNNKTEMLIQGRLEATPEVYAVIAYLNPPGRSDYDALTWVASVKGDTFQISAQCEESKTHNLRLAACHVNGAVSDIFKSDFTVNDELEPEVEALTSRLLTQTPERDFMAGREDRAASQAKKILERDDLPEIAKRKLKHLIALAHPNPNPSKPAAALGQELYLSDLQWQSAEVGWGRPARNQYYCNQNIQDAIFLELDGVFYEKGLYAHAPSKYVFKLEKQFKTFTATAGLLTGVPDVGTAVFVVKGDDKELYRSGILKGRKTVSIKLDIPEVDILELIVESGKEGNACCWSIWTDPKITRK